MNKLRASYSVLSAWEQGRHADAICMHFHLPMPDNPNFAAGKEFHEQWEKHTKETSRLPDIFGGNEIKNAVVEHKIEYELNDWLTLVGKPDVYSATEEVIYEYKSGKQLSSSFMNNYQLGMYAVLLKLIGVNTKKGIIKHYNQHTGETDTTILWLTPQLIQDTNNWVITTASDMFHYLESNKIFDNPEKYYA